MKKKAKNEDWNFKARIIDFFIMLRITLKEFREDRATKLSASLAYYTVFSLPPLILLITTIFSSILSRETVENEIYSTIGSFLGNKGAGEVESMISSVHEKDDSMLSSIIAIVTLFLGATGVFTEIQSSINYIWSVKAKPKRRFVWYIVNRFISFSMIITLGFLLLVTLIINTLVSVFNDNLQNILPMADQLFALITFLITLLVITGLFALIFKILPDAKVEWKYAWRGALFTGVLFTVGKLLIGLYLKNSSLDTTYGAAGTVILILAWVYYTSLILYFGAEFTQVYVKRQNSSIVPKRYAVYLNKTEIEITDKVAVDTK
ncbi:MAG: YihY/virulence factor BrkB family protein [Fimbriimonadaceae bacterium]|nr:YihY/virulence factor BrkB family protein [Chitinophagales bacterium]